MYRDTIEKFTAAGTQKAKMVQVHLLSFLIGSVLAGVYVGFGDILMLTVGAYADPAWARLMMGAVSASSLTISIFAGSELFTGAAMYMPFAVLRGASSLHDLFLVWITCWLGNFAGGIIMAALLHVAGAGLPLTESNGVFFSIVTTRMAATGAELLVRGLLCSWLICLAIWVCGRTENDAAKIALIFWPITIFVACGFEHSVANMFVFALALLGEHPGTASLGGALHNLFWVTLGNIGGGLTVALGYWAQEERGIGHEAHATTAGTAKPTPRPSSLAS